MIRNLNKHLFICFCSFTYSTHQGWVTHICVSNLNIIGSDNGLMPGQCQAIILTNAAILLIETLGTNLSDISVEVLSFSLKKMSLKMSSGKCHPFCFGLNVLIYWLDLEIDIIFSVFVNFVSMSPIMTWWIFQEVLRVFMHSKSDGVPQCSLLCCM